MKSQNGMFWMVHGWVLGQSRCVVLCCVALHDCSEVTHGHHRKRGWGFSFCVGLWWWAEEEEQQQQDMGGNNDGKGDVIALFDVDGTLTYPRKVNSVFFAASSCSLFFFFFFFHHDYILLVLHFVKEAGIVLCGNNRGVDLHQISMPIFLLFLLMSCSSRK
jgi:hypothetical protein